METIMVLEDDIELNDGISYALQREGYTVASARSVGEAKRVMERTAADLAVLDVNLPDGDRSYSSPREIWRRICLRGMSLARRIM